MRIPFDTNHGTIELDPKKGITRGAQTVFSRGHCHSLALAIYEETGWPLIGLGENTFVEPIHIAVKTPDNEMLDIFGKRELDYYYPAILRYLDIEEVKSYKTYKPLAIDAAKPFAMQLLKRYQYLSGTGFASE